MPISEHSKCKTKHGIILAFIKVIDLHLKYCGAAKKMESNDKMNLQGQTNHVHDQFKLEVNTKKIIKNKFSLRSLAWSKPERLKATKAGEGE